MGAAWLPMAKQNDNDEMTLNDRLSALQIFMIIQTFMFILCVQMVLVEMEIAKPTKKKIQHIFAVHLWLLFSQCFILSLTCCF